MSPEREDDPESLREAATRIVRTLRRAGHEAYFVGGCVRDTVRGVEPGDYDIVTSARPDEVRSLFPRTVPVGEAFGVVLAVESGRNYEVATYRTEHGYQDGRRPSEVAFATAEEDVRRRDFTMNGLLMDPETGEVVDLVGGREDIAARLVRTIGEPEERFAEDHLRMLRAVRFAANLGFEVAPAALAAIGRMAPMIARISAERIRDELTKLLVRGGARRGMELLAGTGLLKEVLPEADAMRGVEQPARFHPEGDVWQHVLRMLELMSFPADARLAWGVLLHDIGKPDTRTDTKQHPPPGAPAADEEPSPPEEDDEGAEGVHFYGHTQEGEEIAERVMRRLRFPAAEIEAGKDLVHHHMRFMHVRDMRANKLKRFLRRPDFDLHLELHRLDCLSSHGKLKNYDFCVRKLDEFGVEALAPPRLVTGKDLIAMGFAPGPLFGEILTAVEDAQLDGRVSTAEEAKAMVIERWGGERAQ